MSSDNTLVCLDRALIKKGGLKKFIELSWHQIEPSKQYIAGWHIDAICEHLEAISKGQLKRLVINIPPGCMKSLTACVFWPAWVWTFKPETKWIYASYSMALSRRDNLRMRRLIESEWYRLRFGQVFKPLDDNWGTAKFVNDQAGFRLCTSVDGTVTGEHADVQVCDDPIKPQDISKTSLSNCLEWWNETMSSRLVDFEKSARVIIMQRLHVNDLAGEMLRTGGYDHLCLPMEFERRTVCTTSIGFKDPRIEEKALLWPGRCSTESVSEIKKGIGSERGIAAQLQQHPVPHSGAIFKRQAIQLYEKTPSTPTIISSWDCTFKETGSSYVVGQVWGVTDNCEHYVLIDQVRKRMSFSETLSAIRKIAMNYPQSSAHIIEEKANGSAIIDMLRDEIAGLRAVLPEGGKEARAHAVEGLWSSKKILLPDHKIAPWIDEFIREVLEFPSSINDDQVDAMTQALTWLRERTLKLKTFYKSMNNTGNISCFL
ncbi:MAG: phage terminase large subunit [Myxococcales bacterium]|nr:phage terminase large subunit [Myxococcales bacterium]